METDYIEPGNTVLYEDDGSGIVTITLNRPNALNAINRQLKDELTGAIKKYDGDNKARVALITGAGRAFSAGRDLKERAADLEAGLIPKASDSMLENWPYMWPYTKKPLIAVINGLALAGGWSIAQMCDIRYAAKEALLGITESRVGLLAPFSAVLGKLIPISAVMEIVLSGQHISADRAYDIGFVNKVVDGDNLLEEAKLLAQTIASNAPLSIIAAKEMVYWGIDHPVGPTVGKVIELYEKLLLSHDASEGPRAFSEKRKPIWKGC